MKKHNCPACGIEHQWLSGECSICVGKRKFCNCSSLQNKYPEIAKEWHSKNKGTPNDVYFKSKRYVWWKHECGREWRKRIYARTILETGCPRCRRSHGENSVEDTLLAHDQIFEKEVCLEGMGRLRFDFWVLGYDVPIAIEFDGRQHFAPWKKTNRAKKQFEIIKSYDKRKDEFCLENGIVLYRIAYSCQKKVPELVPAFLKNLPSSGIYYSDKELYEKIP